MAAAGSVRLGDNPVMLGGLVTIKAWWTIHRPIGVDGFRRNAGLFGSIKCGIVGGLELVLHDGTRCCGENVECHSLPRLLVLNSNQNWLEISHLGFGCVVDKLTLRASTVFDGDPPERQVPKNQLVCLPQVHRLYAIYTDKMC